MRDFVDIQTTKITSIGSCRSSLGSTESGMSGVLEKKTTSATAQAPTIAAKRPSIAYKKIDRTTRKIIRKIATMSDPSPWLWLTTDTSHSVADPLRKTASDFKQSQGKSGQGVSGHQYETYEWRYWQTEVSASVAKRRLGGEQPQHLYLTQGEGPCFYHFSLPTYRKLSFILTR